MKRRKTDTQTIDMFYIPPPPVTCDRGLACRGEIAQIMSFTMKGRNREEIAHKVTRMTGVSLSIARLNQMCAPSAEGHTPPLDQAVAFDVATGNHALVEFFANKVGGRFVAGAESLDIHLAKKMRELNILSREIKELKRVIGGTL
jgi:hypothetical protein